jgi:spore coat polysaccharide biosynthesis protein SpsF
MKRRLVAALACRNQGSRLYGKPLQNLDMDKGIRIIDNILDSLSRLNFIDQIVLGIAEGKDNEVYKDIAESRGLRFIVGDQVDVLHRLILCGEVSGATDIFRVTSESPFLYFERAEVCWQAHKESEYDATFMEDVVDGCGFEIIKLDALKVSHVKGDKRHRSELCTLFIRENKNSFKVKKFVPPASLIRKDLRLTVDYPEDLIVCRAVFRAFKNQAPLVPLARIIKFLDRNPHLISLISPFSEAGYRTMYK